MELWKQKQQLANEAYCWITDYLLQHQFQFPGCSDEEPMERDTLMNWIDLPSILPALSVEQISSVNAFFYQKASSYVKDADATTVMDVRQHRIGKCASIVKGIAILYQNSPSLLQQDVHPWIALCEEAMHLSCSARDDCISLSHLWVLLSLSQGDSSSAESFISELVRLIDRVQAGSQLRLMLYRQLLLHFSLADLLPLTISLSMSPDSHTSTSPSTHLSTSPSTHTSTSPSTHLSTSSSTHSSTSPSTHLSTSPSTHSSTSPSTQEDDGFLHSLQEAISTMALNTVDESVSQVEVMGMLVSKYVDAHVEIPPSCAEATLNLLVQYLNSSARKLTKQSEDVLSLLIRSASVVLHPLYHL